MIRSVAERSRHARELLISEDDAWVGSASDAGDAYLIPLTFLWNGSSMLFSTPESSRTARDLRRTGKTRVALPATRDVVILDGQVEFLDPLAVADWIDAFVARHTWDPRTEPNPYCFFAFTPERVQAWSEASELSTRMVMRDGIWLDAS